MSESMRAKDVPPNTIPVSNKSVPNMLMDAHFSPDKKDEIRLSYEKDKSLILGKTKEQLKALIASVEANIQSINDARKENTGIVGGLGDALSEWIRLFGGKGYETGKDIYNQSLKQTQSQAKELHAKILAECNGKDFSVSEKAEIDALIQRLETAAGSKLAEVSWGKAVFNSAGVDDIKWDAGTLKNRAKIFAKTTIGMTEWVFDLATFLAKTTGKGIGVVSAYAFTPETRELIKQDISEIFSGLTYENAKKVLALLPDALEKFANATPDVQAEGFGKFMWGLLVGWWAGVKLFQWGKYAAKLGYRAVRMAAHKWAISAVPLALAWTLQMGAGVAAASTGVALRVGEMDVIPGKTAGKKVLQNMEGAEGKILAKETKKALSSEDKNLREQAVRKNAAEMNDAKRLADAEQSLREKWLLNDTETLVKSGLVDESGKLTPKVKDLILAGHNVGKPVYEQDFASIMSKAKNSKWLPKAWKKQLMDEGFMGSENTVGRQIMLAELAKTDRQLANQMESFLDSERKIKFSEWAKDRNLWTRGDEWADKIISSTIVPLEKARGKMKPELFEQLKVEIYANLQKQLKEHITYRLNGHFEWIEQLGVSECFDKLAKHGFHVQPEFFSPKEIGQRWKEAIDMLLFRAKISSAGVVSTEKVSMIRKEVATKRAELWKKLTAKDVSQDMFAIVQTDLVAQEHLLTGKIADLKKLQEELAGLKNINSQEIEAKKNVALAIKSLEEELSTMTRFKDGPEITTASKKLDADKLEKWIQEAKSVRETTSRAMNAKLENVSQEEKADIFLKNTDFDVNALNADRFFNLTFSELPDATRKLFTTEVMARFWRDASGQLTPESIELGVQFYGPKVLRNPIKS